MGKFKVLSNRVEIVNNSLWPDWAMKVIIPEIVKQTGITWDYKVILPLVKDNIWAGRGGRTQQRSRVPRRYKTKWPHNIVEWRYKDADTIPIVVNSRLELLIFLLAHEAHHANGGNRRNFIRSGRIDRKSMEIECNDHGRIIVEYFRANRKYFFSLLRDVYRKHYYETCVRKEPALKAKVKLEKLVVLRDKWTRKEVSVQKKIAKYNKQIRYYEKRIERLSE